MYYLCWFCPCTILLSLLSILLSLLVLPLHNPSFLTQPAIIPAATWWTQTKMSSQGDVWLIEIHQLHTRKLLHANLAYQYWVIVYLKCCLLSISYVSFCFILLLLSISAHLLTEWTQSNVFSSSSSICKVFVSVFLASLLVCSAVEGSAQAISTSV